MADDRVERPGQPDVLCNLRIRARIRLSSPEGREADARRPPQGQGDSRERHPRGDGAQRRGAARLRPVGDGPPGYLGAMEMFRPTKGGGVSVWLSAGEATLLRTLVVPVLDLLNDP